MPTVAAYTWTTEGRPNEENAFECLGGGNANGTEHGTVIGLVLPPCSSLAPLLLPVNV
jgi:hypothetical protein